MQSCLEAERLLLTLYRKTCYAEAKGKGFVSSWRGHILSAGSVVPPLGKSERHTLHCSHFDDFLCAFYGRNILIYGEENTKFRSQVTI